MNGDCDEQLEHVNRNADSGIICIYSRKKARLGEVMIVINIAVRKEDECGLQLYTPKSVVY